MSDEDPRGTAIAGAITELASALVGAGASPERVAVLMIGFGLAVFVENGYAKAAVLAAVEHQWDTESAAAARAH